MFYHARRDWPCTMLHQLSIAYLRVLQGYLHAMNLGMCLFLNTFDCCGIGLAFWLREQIKTCSSWVSPTKDRKIPRVFSSWRLNERVLLRLQHSHALRLDNKSLPSRWFATHKWQTLYFSRYFSMWLRATWRHRVVCKVSWVAFARNVTWG